MSARISLYPVLSEDLLVCIGLQVIDYEFEYDNRNRSRLLSAKPLVGQEHVVTRLGLTDEYGEWDPEVCNLRFRRRIIIPNFHLLFGRDGIAPEDAEIGIAVKWMSKPSRQRGVFKGESMKLTNGKTDFLIQGEFPPGILRGHVDLSTILYLKTPGMLRDGEQHLANSSGIELGVLDNMSFYLSGEGSNLPIFTVKDNGPLWRVECNWDDPRIDPFDESSFRILLNENHPDFKFLYSNDEKKITPLMKEVFLSALQILMENVLAQVPENEVRSGRDAESGSLCMAVKYFIETFGLSVSPKEGLARSLRDKIYDKLGGIA